VYLFPVPSSLRKEGGKEKRKGKRKGKGKASDLSSFEKSFLDWEKFLHFDRKRDFFDFYYNYFETGMDTTESA